jgi:hypothetical protein
MIVISYSSLENFSHASVLFRTAFTIYGTLNADEYSLSYKMKYCTMKCNAIKLLQCKEYRETVNNFSNSGFAFYKINVPQGPIVQRWVSANPR